MYAIQAKAGIRVYLIAISPFPIVASYLKVLDISATVTFLSEVSIVAFRACLPIDGRLATRDSADHRRRSVR